MAKFTRSVAMTNATITFEDDQWMVTEYTKDDMMQYKLEDILEKFKDVEGVSVTIKQGTDIAPYVGG